MAGITINSFGSEPRDTPERRQELERLRKLCREEINNNPTILEYFKKEWLEEGVNSLSLLIENNNPVINLISKGSILFVIQTLSRLKDKKVKGFDAQLAKLITDQKKLEIWAEIEAASLLSQVCEVEFFERTHPSNTKTPDLRCQKSFVYYAEVYLPKQNEEFTSLEKTEMQSGRRVKSVQYMSNKMPFEYLYERIRGKYQQFENYNRGILFVDFTFAGVFLSDVESLKTALKRIFEKKFKDQNTLSRHLIGVFCTKLSSDRDRYFFYDNEDERSVKLNTELLELFD